MAFDVREALGGKLFDGGAQRVHGQIAYRSCLSNHGAPSKREEEASSLNHTAG
jgi:hypothetical protein